MSEPTRTVAEILTALRAPRPSHELEWLVVATNKEKTKGLAVPYLSASAIHAILDDVLGAENWRNEYVPWSSTGAICLLSLRLDGEWLTKSDGAPFPDTEPVKGVFSNALKRAAGVWGIGRYLHAFPGEWVPVVACGKSVRLEEVPILPDELLPPDERGQSEKRRRGSTNAGDGTAPQASADSPRPKAADETAGAAPRRTDQAAKPRRTDPPAPNGRARISPMQQRMIPQLATDAGISDADLLCRVRAYKVNDLAGMTAADAAQLFMALQAEVKKKKGK